MLEGAFWLLEHSTRGQDSGRKLLEKGGMGRIKANHSAPCMCHWLYLHFDGRVCARVWRERAGHGWVALRSLLLVLHAFLVTKPAILISYVPKVHKTNFQWAQNMFNKHWHHTKERERKTAFRVRIKIMSFCVSLAVNEFWSPVIVTFGLLRTRMS